MKKFASWWAEFVTTRPWLVIVAVFAITGAIGTGLPRLLSMPMRPVLEGSIPDSDPWVKEWQKVREVFPHREFYLIALECNEKGGVYTSTCLSAVQELGYELESFPGRKSEVQSIFNRSYTPLDVATGDLRIEPIASPKIIGSSELINLFKKRAENDPDLFGKIVSKDHRATLLWFAADTKQETAFQTLEGIRKKFNTKEHRVLAFSNHWINGSIEKIVQEDTSILGALGLLFIISLMWVSLSGAAVPIVFLVVTLAIIWTFGIMGYLGIPQNVLTSAVPLILIAAASASSFHLVVRARTEFRRTENKVIKIDGKDETGRAVKEAMEKLFLAIVLSEATTAVGFGTLYAFRIASVSEFGVYVAVAINTALPLSLSLAPVLLVTMARRAVIRRPGKVAQAFERANEKLVELWLFTGVSRPRESFALSLFFVFVLAAFGLPKLEVGSNPPYFFPAGHPVREVFEGWSEHFGADGFLTVMADSGKENGIYEPEFLKKVSEFGSFAEGLPKVANALSLAKPVARLNRVMTSGLSEDEKIPEDEAVVRELMDLYGNSTPKEVRELRDDSRRYLTIDFLADVNDSAKVAALRDTLKSWANSHGLVTYMGGEFFLWAAQNIYIVEGKLINIACSIFFVFVLCALGYKSIRIGALALVPVSLSTLVVFSVMALVGIRLDIANCTVSTIVVGLGVNFAVHLINTVENLSKEESQTNMKELLGRAVIEAGPAIQYNALATMGFLIFLWSGFVPVRSFGWLVATSMVSATILTFLCIPFLIGSIGRKHFVSQSGKKAAA